MLLYPETKSTVFDLTKQQQQLFATSKYLQQSNNSLKFSIASLLFNKNSNNLLPGQTVSNETCNQHLKHYFINNTSNSLNKFFDSSDLNLSNNQLTTSNKICHNKSICKDYFCVKCSNETSSPSSTSSNLNFLHSNSFSCIKNNNNNLPTLEVNSYDNNVLNVVDDDNFLDGLLNQTDLPSSICLQDNLNNNNFTSKNGNLLTCSQNQNLDKRVVLRAMIMNMNKNELTSNLILNKELCKLTNQFYHESQQCSINTKTDSTQPPLSTPQGTQLNTETDNTNFNQIIPVNLNKNFFLNETTKINLTTNKTSVGKLNSSSIGNKKKRIRTIFSPEQLEVLEYHFRQKAYMVGHERLYLASSLNLSEAQVKVWFQNRRIKSRKFEVEKKNLF